RSDVREQTAHRLDAMLCHREGVHVLDGADEEEREGAVAAEEVLRLGEEVLLLRLLAQDALARVGVSAPIVERLRTRRGDGGKLGEERGVLRRQWADRGQAGGAAPALVEELREVELLPTGERVDGPD